MFFPLYDILKNKSKNIKSLSEKQIDEFIEFVEKSIDIPDIHEHLYIIIKKYNIIEFNGQNYSIPFNGKQNNSEISFEIDDLPDELQRMLYSFVILEKEK